MSFHFCYDIQMVVCTGGQWSDSVYDHIFGISALQFFVSSHLNGYTKSQMHLWFNNGNSTDYSWSTNVMCD